MQFQIHVVYARAKRTVLNVGMGELRPTSRLRRCTRPAEFEDPINSRCFQTWVEQQLVPTLKPDDIVILDNLASHKAKAVRQAVRCAGARDDRPGLDSCVRALRTGDVLVVWKLDRLGRPRSPGAGGRPDRATARKRLQRRPHPSSASDSTNRTRSACREMECFW